MIEDNACLIRSGLNAAAGNLLADDRLFRFAERALIQSDYYFNVEKTLT